MAEYGKASRKMTIRHCGRGAQVWIYLGKPFDIVGEDKAKTFLEEKPRRRAIRPTTTWQNQEREVLTLAIEKTIGMGYNDGRKATWAHADFQQVHR